MNKGQKLKRLEKLTDMLLTLDNDNPKKESVMQEHYTLWIEIHGKRVMKNGGRNSTDSKSQTQALRYNEIKGLRVEEILNKCREFFSASGAKGHLRALDTALLVKKAEEVARRNQRRISLVEMYYWASEQRILHM